MQTNKGCRCWVPQWRGRWGLPNRRHDSCYQCLFLSRATIECGAQTLRGNPTRRPQRQVKVWRAWQYWSLGGLLFSIK
jgi:hypothetical protein